MISSIESIKFSDISYSVESRQILSNVHGEFRPNRLTAILGASGSGKTTLLKIISGRLNCENRKIMMGHYNLSRKALREISSFVQQEDVLPKHDTVEEAINFSRLLRNKDYRMEDLRDLSLEHMHDSSVSTLSSGEKKRLSVALELVSSPHLIYLDEPISGADYSTAVGIVKHLKKLCLSRTVVMAVHQPSSDIFFEFDDILVLKEGYTVYYGPTNGIFEFFKSMNLSCPNYSNPADFLFLHVLPLCTPEMNATQVADEMNFETNVLPSKNHASAIEQFKLVYLRNLREKTRDVLGCMFFVASMLVASAVIGLIFYNLQRIQDKDVRDKNTMGLLNFCSTSFIFTSSLGILSSLYDNYKLFLKEYQLGYYSVVPYFTAQILNDTVLNIVIPTTSCILIHVITRLGYGTRQFMVFLANAIFTTLIGQCLGLLGFVLLPNMSIALLVLLLVLLFLAVLNGMFVDSSGLLGVFRVAQYFSPFRYSFNILLKNHESKDGIIVTWIDNNFFGVKTSLFIEFLMIPSLFGLSLLLFCAKTRKML
eukprot:jgi/Antlo1/83/1362